MSFDDVIPGFVLTPPGWLDLAAIEDAVTRRHYAVVVGAATDADPKHHEWASQWAAGQMRARPFAFGTPAFAERLRTPHGLITALWYCLRRKYPNMSMADVDNLISPDNFEAITRAVLELCSYRTTQKKTDPMPPPAP